MSQNLGHNILERRDEKNCDIECSVRTGKVFAPANEGFVTCQYYGCSSSH